LPLHAAGGSRRTVEQVSSEHRLHGRRFFRYDSQWEAPSSSNLLTQETLVERLPVSWEDQLPWPT